MKIDENIIHDFHLIRIETETRFHMKCSKYITKFSYSNNLKEKHSNV